MQTSVAQELKTLASELVRAARRPPPPGPEAGREEGEGERRQGPCRASRDEAALVGEAARDHPGHHEQEEREDLQKPA
jgi:hypothetical protein